MTLKRWIHQIVSALHPCIRVWSLARRFALIEIVQCFCMFYLDGSGFVVFVSS
jgi:hypothetical protein